ncbi:hypothetical protein MHPYR_180115 [uncultured Mycobacterium sp.]|uniref:Uncharacterized protein n=1 Tax=uncultured Mycobacterium sp. TaxID=171292 RepID=A0A1Y5P5E7_9MYCO|nr:hypothetical protein MHPYR_180115 [uncultured Mycobacterium sp.]
MTTTDAPTMPAYRLIESPDRIYAVDENDIELCGAYRPNGHSHFCVYVTLRLSDRLHHVYATTSQAAREHVLLLAELATGGVR